jgi:hypothetical protein
MVLTTIDSNTRTTSAENISSFGGGIRAGATTTLAGDTITGNSANTGANVYDNAASTIQSTIVAEPQGTGANCATITSLGNNLADDASCDHQIGLGDQQNTPPQLFPLLPNGGPTFTRRPMPGSPAIDFGTFTGQSTDQRGLQRTWDFMFPYDGLLSATDVGAVEVQGPTITATNPASPSDVATPSVIGTVESGSTVQLFTSGDCTNAAIGPPTGGSAFASSGIPIGPLALNTATTVRATAAYGGPYVSGCSNPITYERKLFPTTTTTPTGTVGTKPKKCKKGFRLKKVKGKKKCVRKKKK